MRAPVLPRRRASATGSQAAPAAGPVRIAPRPPLDPGRRAALRTRLVGAAPLAGLLVLAASVALTLTAPAARLAGSPVLVLAHDLPAGALLQRADLRAAWVAAAPAQLAALVPAAEEVAMVGRTLVASLEAGEPLVRSALAAGPDPAALTLSVGAEHALGGALVPGDRVSVLATFATADGGSLTRVLARGLVVLAVGAVPSLGDASEVTLPVTLALDDTALAPRLALANSIAHIDLLRDGAATPRPMSPASLNTAAA